MRFEGGMTGRVVVLLRARDLPEVEVPTGRLGVVLDEAAGVRWSILRIAWGWFGMTPWHDADDVAPFIGPLPEAQAARLRFAAQGLPAGVELDARLDVFTPLFLAGL
jgi:hypothetical protein